MCNDAVHGDGEYSYNRVSESEDMIGYYLSQFISVRETVKQMLWEYGTPLYSSAF